MTHFFRIHNASTSHFSQNVKTVKTCAKSKDDHNFAHPFTFGASSSAFLLWVRKNWPFGCPSIPPDLFLTKNGSHFYIFGSFLPISPSFLPKHHPHQHKNTDDMISADQSRVMISTHWSVSCCHPSLIYIRSGRARATILFNRGGCSCCWRLRYV